MREGGGARCQGRGELRRAGAAQMRSRPTAGGGRVWRGLLHICAGGGRVLLVAARRLVTQ